MVSVDFLPEMQVIDHILGYNPQRNPNFSMTNKYVCATIFLSLVYKEYSIDNFYANMAERRQ